MQEMQKEIENLKKKKTETKKPQNKKTTKTQSMSAARRLLNSYEKGQFIDASLVTFCWSSKEKVNFNK